MKKERKKYSQEFKEEAVKLLLSENSTHQEVASNLGISLSTLGRWKRSYLNAHQNSSQAFPGQGNLSPHDAELKQLQKEVMKLKRERDILKKAMAYFTHLPE